MLTVAFIIEDRCSCLCRVLFSFASLLLILSDQKILHTHITQRAFLCGYESNRSITLEDSVNQWQQKNLVKVRIKCAELRMTKRYWIFICFVVS